MKNLEELAEQLSMTELIRLQDVLSKAIVRRFEKRLALVFSDVVGSTPYFAHFGDEAGRKLQQRHYDLVNAAIGPEGGRVVDTAGDGVFLCFESVTAAARAMVGLQRSIVRDNDSRAAEHRLNLRIGIHVGPVLTDGVLVSGDAVNFCSRVAGSAGSGELRLSLAAYSELTELELRLRSRRQRAVELKGVDKPQELFTLDWLDANTFPSKVRFEDGTEHRLPPLDVIRFGRLREQDGATANDVVITVSDQTLQSRISRWHFELHRRADGFMLRSVSTSTTEIDGRAVARGEEVVVRPGAKVKLGGAITLEFASEDFSQEMTLLPT
ncbi:MAG: adenylate/guanylate cyclase domain-containing protein [Archangium sp.]|nr:adenylate/guanylate cyclase domain-containing protein [Archangium sp.]